LESVSKHPLGRERRWDKNMKMDHVKTGCENVNWMELAQDYAW
jgi:hypothetical protein